MKNSEGNGYFTILNMVIVSQVYIHVKSYQFVHFKYMQFMRIIIQ